MDFVEGVKLGISPPEINLRGSVDERICDDFFVYVEGYDGKIEGKDYWSRSLFENRDLRDYSFSSRDIGVRADYPLEFEARKEKKLELNVENLRKQNLIIIKLLKS